MRTDLYPKNGNVVKQLLLTPIPDLDCVREMELRGFWRSKRGNHGLGKVDIGD